MSARVVIIQGGPASGKTTLSHKLSKDLDVRILSKDEIKEFLFDNFMLPKDRNESRVLGMATFEAQFAMAKVFIDGGLNFIIEGAFHTEFANADFGRLVREHDVEFAQVYCRVDVDEQRRRYNDRVSSGKRHLGHHDDVREDSTMFVDAGAIYGPLDMKQTMNYDSSDISLDQYRKVVKFIQEFLEE